VPKSKVRKVSRPTTAPARPVTPEEALPKALFALYMASTDLVREAELRITHEVRAGQDPAQAIEVHHLIRTGALGFLTAYSELTGLPDPRELWQTTQA
jgi:hypothetical protein